MTGGLRSASGVTFRPWLQACWARDRPAAVTTQNPRRRCRLRGLAGFGVPPRGNPTAIHMPLVTGSQWRRGRFEVVVLDREGKTNNTSNSGVMLTARRGGLAVWRWSTTPTTGPPTANASSGHLSVGQRAARSLPERWSADRCGSHYHGSRPSTRARGAAQSLPLAMELLGSVTTLNGHDTQSRLRAFRAGLRPARPSGEVTAVAR